MAIQQTGVGCTHCRRRIRVYTYMRLCKKCYHTESIRKRYARQKLRYGPQIPDLEQRLKRLRHRAAMRWPLFAGNERNAPRDSEPEQPARAVGAAADGPEDDGDE